MPQQKYLVFIKTGSNSLKKSKGLSLYKHYEEILVMLRQGLYEQVVNKEIKEELIHFSDAEKHIEKIDSTEAASVLTQYLSEVVSKGLDRIAGDDISAQLELVNKIVGLISQETAEEDLQKLTVSDDGEQLLALLSSTDPLVRIGQKKAKDLPRPETSIAQSSLFTGATTVCLLEHCL